MRIHRYFIVASAAVGILMIGCGKSDVQNKLEQAVDSLRKAANTNNSATNGGSGQTGTDGKSGSGEHHPVPAADFHQLQSYLPQINGYTKGTPQGSSAQMGEWNYSMASAEYHMGDDATITVAIYDYAFIESLIQAYKMKFSFENEEGYTKSVDFGGNPGWESFQKNDHTANCTALVGDRFVAVVEGHGQNDASLVRSTISGMNLQGLAGLH